MEYAPLHKQDDFIYSTAYGVLCKPGLQHLLSLLKLDVTYIRAKREFLYRLNSKGEEERVIDMLGGYGSTILGHNPPEIVSALKNALDQEVAVHAQASIRVGATIVAERLNSLIVREFKNLGEENPPKYLVHLLNTGTEASEAAIKHALMEWTDRKEMALLTLERLKARLLQSRETPPLRQKNAEFIQKIETVEKKLTEIQPVFIAIEGSFHGKTAGSLALTSNPSYSSMYPQPAVHTIYISRNASVDQVHQIFEKHSLQLSERESISLIAGVVIEPIQGEGGIHFLDHDLVVTLSQHCKQQGVPLIADEIQSGLYRTGKFLGVQHYGVEPDYITLGKSLGGGLAKVSALLVRQERYQEDFGIKHTSTFGEDDLSSRVAATVLDLLAKDSASIEERAAAFEKQMKEALREMMKKYPGVIKDVRGAGFMIGIEFDPSLGGTASHFLDALAQSQYLTYVFASYLLHRHGVRVAATLNESNTLRLEPTAYIELDSILHTLKALEKLVEHLYHGRMDEITRHLHSEVEPGSISEVISTPRFYRRSKNSFGSRSEIRKVAFISHLIDERHLGDLDPAFRGMGKTGWKLFLNDFGSMGKSILIHQQDIEGANGQRILFEAYGITSSASYFEDCLKTGDPGALLKVRETVGCLRASGVSRIGLGQYTSIVTENGLLISESGAPVTTGNSLTVGFSLKALKKLLRSRGQTISDLHVGIVGVAGNICNVYTQLIADYVRELTLIHREPFDQNPKFQAAVREILWNSRIEPDRIHKTSELSTLIDCDVVVLGTNSTRQMLLPEHLKKNALVLDISVPSNVHPRVFSERPDVHCVQGGYAQLPLGQKLVSPMLYTPNGEVFACMAETMVLGLLDYPESFSRGALTKEKIVRITRMAREVGFDLGSVKQMNSVFGS